MRTLQTALVLAAGRGERMRPLTERIPKPLAEIAGRSLLDRTLDALHRFGVTQVVVNACHLAQQIENRLAQRDSPVTMTSVEPKALETGGGVKRALPHLGSHAFLVTNADVVVPRAHRAYRLLEQHWDGTTMDALLLVIPREGAAGYSGDGDFALRFRHAGAVPLVRTEGGLRPYVFTGMQVLSPHLFDNTPDRHPFPLSVVYRKARLNGRLFGMVFKDAWFHVGTVQALRDTERILSDEASAT